ncbi:hypothetical protein BDD21_0240 [Thiocapsa rosea]|uniref:Uncharacterized protein n=1 Tax=Thiocapsa rosea TaxID=69360 RepID=A0A495V583_9GAMM|nr:hypothetical protein BDD21_0240 [Thiocapsa rosea]
MAEISWTEETGSETSGKWVKFCLLPLASCLVDASCARDAVRPIGIAPLAPAVGQAGGR